MKLKYLIPLFIATVALMTSCTEEDPVTLLDEIQVSSSFVTLPMDGGSATITVTAQDKWTAKKEITKKDSVKWLEISTVSGNAGETELIFSADSTLDGRNAEVLLNCGGQTQRVNIMQGLPIATEYTVADAKKEPDGKLVRVTGVCTQIDNTLYGNWYITDETGSLFIYGTLDEKGNPKNFLSHNLEVGDEVTIEGPKSTHNNEPQLVDVTVIEINKSYVKVDSLENEVLPLEGGEFIAHLTLNDLAQGVSVDIPEDVKDWLSITSIQTTETGAVVKLYAKENTGGDRSTTITFSTTDEEGKEYSTQATLTQKGSIVKVSVAEFLAAEVGDTQYRLAGVITEIDEKYNNNLYIRDFSGKTYAYKLDLQGKKCKVGDIITIAGKRAEYKGEPQVAGGVLESVISVTPITIAEVLAKPDSKEDYFMVTGVITKIKDEDWGNLYLKDDSGEIYLYGCYPGYGATGDDRKGLIAAKGIKEGDKLTVIATKGSHEGNVQLANGIYFSHESAK